MDLADQMRPALTAREIPNIMAAAAVLRDPVDKPWAIRMMTAAHHHMGEFSLQGLGLMLWAVGRMGMRTRADWAARYMAALSARMGGADGSAPRAVARALSLAMHGLGSTGCRPGDEWMGRWMAAVARRRRALAPRDVACMLVGMQRLRCGAVPGGATGWHCVDQDRVAAPMLSPILTTLPHPAPRPAGSPLPPHG
jgi:hypothetical protein